MTRRAVAVVLLAALAASSAPAAARDAVRVLALADALDPQVLDGAARAAGVDVLLDGFAMESEVEAALRAPGAGYDLVLLPAEAVGARVTPESLLPLAGAVPEAAGVPAALAAGLGPAARVAVPFDWYPTGFAVNAAKLKNAGLPADPAAGWDVLANPDLLRRALACGFGWPADVRSAYAVAATTGSGTEATERRRVMALLSQVRAEAHVGPTAELADGLASGDLCAAVLPAPDALLAAARARAADGGVDLAFTVPSGGVPLAVDVLAVPLAARDRAGGLALLRALLRPAAVQANASATHVAPAVGSDASEPAFDASVLSRARLPPTPDAALLRALRGTWDRGSGR